MSKFGFKLLRFERKFRLKHIGLFFLCCAAVAIAATPVHANSINACSFSENQFFDFVGGAAAGTALTSSIAGESIVIIVTQTGVLFATAPAVTPAVTLVAGTSAIAYGTLKAYCSRHEAADKVMTWYEASVDSTSNGMEIAVDQHGRLVDYTSRVFEGVASTQRRLSKSLSDYLCRVTGDC